VNLALVLPLAAGTVLLAGLGLAVRAPFAGSAALAGMGVLVGALLLSDGYAGLAVAALGVVWGVAAAGLVVARRLTEAEAQGEEEASRGPWALAFVASALLTLAFGLGVVVVDWPAAGAALLAATAPGSALPAALGPPPGGDLVAEWALAALGIAVALALSAFAPRAREE
jgi:hypothetical protein